MILILIIRKRIIDPSEVKLLCPMLMNMFLPFQGRECNRIMIKNPALFFFFIRLHGMIHHSDPFPYDFMIFSDDIGNDYGARKIKIIGTLVGTLS